MTRVVRMERIECRNRAVALCGFVASASSHRDIGPEKFFLTLDGRVKILGFGLAN